MRCPQGRRKKSSLTLVTRAGPAKPMPAPPCPRSQVTRRYQVGALCVVAQQVPLPALWRTDARTISTTEEDPGPPSISCMRGSGCPELKGGSSPHTELSCVGPEIRQGLQTAQAGSQAAARQAMRGGVQASGRVTHTAGPVNGRGRKRRSRKNAAQAHKFPRHCLFPEAPASQSSVPLPPSSPRVEPSSRHRAPGASPGSLASRPGPDLRSRTSPPPGPVLRSHTTLRGLTIRPCASEPGPASRLRSASASTAASARGRAPGSCRAPALPRCAVRSQASGSGIPPHSCGSARGRARRRCASPPGPASRRRCAPSPVPDRQHRTSATSSTRRRGASRPQGRLGCSASVPNPPSRSRASVPGPTLRSQASGSSPALRNRSSPISSALSRSSTTAGFVPQSRTTQRRSTRSSCPPPPEPAGQRPPSSPIASGSLVAQSSSSCPAPGAPSLPSQPSWHAVRMRASSPSPPGRLYPFPGWFVENPSSSSSCPSPPTTSLCTSTSGFPDQGPSTPPNPIVSGNSSSSSSPNFDDLSSISNLSPASLRRALLLEFDVLSPASPGEQAEIESIHDSPTPPPSEL
ncbi:EZH inhibitory protein [Desmodus rotundus]|uniref:EZH inhibitory protein n=1 Tax=Desmodus rotundus TaxID=9430 RepID=UPI0023813D0A|nr:EZH inhibitory protein [Desmodus rotundus]